jgi:acetyltransferase-like isoleucine patch superfamily enzyme
VVASTRDSVTRPAPGLLFALRWWRLFFRRRLAGTLFRYRQLIRGVYIEPGLMLAGGGEVRLEPGVVIQRGATLATRPGSKLTIGPESRIGPDVVISVAEQVTLGRSVLTAARCYISDHNHEFSDPGRPVLQQGMTRPRPVTIGDGSWLGINVCILPGVSLGRNCVVAANSVVTSSFPDYSVVGGAPARLLRSTVPAT